MHTVRSGHRTALLTILLLPALIIFFQVTGFLPAPVFHPLLSKSSRSKWSSIPTEKWAAFDRLNPIDTGYPLLAPRAAASQDMAVVYERRVSSIIGHMDATLVANISSWYVLYESKRECRLRGTPAVS